MSDVLLQEAQAVSLVLLLLLSFVLPYAATSFPGKKAVQLAWMGQMIMALAGIAMLVWPGHAYNALACGFAGCGIFVYLIYRAGDSARPVQCAD